MRTTCPYSRLVDQLADMCSPYRMDEWSAVNIVQACGADLTLSNDQEVLDFASEVSGALIGHNHPTVLAAAAMQMQKYAQSCGQNRLFQSPSRLMDALSKVMQPGLDVFFFSPSEQEAIDDAIRLAHQINQRRIIGFIGGDFPSQRDPYSTWDFPIGRQARTQILPNFHECVYLNPWLPGGTGKSQPVSFGDYLNGLDRPLAHEQISALIVRPFPEEQGTLGGGLLPQIQQYCQAHQILLILDERQSGFGRLGAMLAADLYHLKPDILILGRSIANGFSLNVTALRRDLINRWLPGAQGNLMFANPISCAAALATIDAIREEALLENCARMGDRLLAGLRAQKSEVIKNIWGKGLLVILELDEDGLQTTSHYDRCLTFKIYCLEQSLLVSSVGIRKKAICLMPPLTVTADQIDRSVEILDRCIKKLARVN